ncbi:MAG TPA: ABC transporter substrate-binding protein [Bryobacteraceae bacterium]|nr:ABC transporter substrate-binding protein [Bryobacteraceae bacterium]
MSLFGLGIDAGQRLRRDALDAFSHRSGIQVDLFPTWGSSGEQLMQIQRFLRQRSSAPDVFVVDVIWPGTIGKDLIDLNPFRDRDARRHLPALLENDTVQGRLVSLPFYLNVGILYYRTDLLKKYGFAHPPATWDELERAASRIQQGERAAGKKDFWGYVWQGAAYEGLTCNALEWQGAFGGGRIIAPDGTITVNNPHVATALKKASGWVGTISPPSVLSYTEADSLNVFRAGNAAFLRHWSGGVPPGGLADAPIQGRFAVTLLPAGPAGRAQTTGGFHLAVSRYCAHRREALQLVLYLSGAEVQLRRALARGYLPTIPSLYENPDLARTLPWVALFQNSSRESWIARPSTVTGSKYGEVSRAYYLAVHAVLGQKARPEEALEQLEKRLVELTGFRTGPPQS